jgi:hypothetical protein
LIGLAVFVLICTAAFVGHTSNLLVLAMITAVGVLAGMTYRGRRMQGFSRHSQNHLNGRSGLVAAAFGILLLLIGYLVWTKSLFSWSAGLLIATCLFGVARFTTANFAHFFSTFLAVQCSLNALDAIKTVYFVSLRSSCGNDAAAMASMTGVPAWIWAIVWAILSIFILFISTALYARKSISTSPLPV